MTRRLSSDPLWPDFRRKFAVASVVFLFVVPVAAALALRGVSRNVVLLFVVASGVLLPPLILHWLRERQVTARSTHPHGDTHTLWALPVTRHRITLLVGVGILVALTSLYAFLHEPTAIHQTAIGEIQTLKLDDGSSLKLAPLSEVHVRFDDRLRAVSLDHGEAFFNVAHDPKRPFEVDVGERVLRAVGTAFNVRIRRSATVEVLVTEGRVAIENERRLLTTHVPQGPIEVRQGQSIVLSWESAAALTEVSPQEIERKLSWREGLLWFSGEPLSEMVEELNRFSTRKLVIDDPALASVAIGGSFATSDVEPFLESLAILKGVKHRIVTRGDGVEEIHLFRTGPANRNRLDREAH